mgnify:FL=1
MNPPCKECGQEWQPSHVIDGCPAPNAKPLDTIRQFPHCDPLVLHAPGDCEFCDRHPEWQQLRQMWKINFTGQYEPDRQPCPAEDKRDLVTIEQWGGNIPWRFSSRDD